MQAVWQFLSTTYPGSTIDSAGFWSLGEQHAQPETWVTPLSQYGFVAVDGPDTSKFLQGQTSCDWRRITTGLASPGSYCNIKGRALSTFLASLTGEHTALLRMRADITHAFCDTLAKYIVFSKASMREVSDQWLALGVAGHRARDVIERVFSASPSGHYTRIATAMGSVIQADPAGNQFECWLKADQCAEILGQLSQQVPLVSNWHWQRLQIDRGLAEIATATQDMFLPQMLNLQLDGGVSFKKGCYTGQEVIARMEYRGKLKKQLFRAHLPQTATVPPPGAKVLLRDSRQSVGEIVNSAPFAEGSVLLAVLNTETATSGAALLVDDLPDQSLQALTPCRLAEV